MFTLLLALACAGSPAPSAPTTAGTEAAATSLREIDVATLKADLDGKKVPILVDVRSPQEFSSGHVPGAKNIPIDQLASRESELEAHKSGDVYVICAVGGRSAAASKSLAGKGFHAVNVAGGTKAWTAAGYPTE